MRVRVSRSHILRGEALSPSNCPIALAIQDELGAHWVIVGPTSATWQIGALEPWHDAPLPWRASVFVGMYDMLAGLPLLRRIFIPFSFDVKEPR